MENEGRYNNKIKEIDETKKQIELKKAQEKDESKGAERVNQYLKIYFGSDEIQIMIEKLHINDPISIFFAKE